MKNIDRRQGLDNFKSIVVKVGSKILTSSSEDYSDSHTKRVDRLVNDISVLKKNGIDVILVSSGAVAHGVVALNLKKRPKTIPLKQACASIGQIKLMHLYEKLFSKNSLTIGQVLLTKSDLNIKQNYLNFRNTVITLLENSVIPIVNENDSVGVDEIRFGDNDTLGAQIALLTDADLFINLSDINGLYDSNPKKNSSAKHIPLVEKVTKSVTSLADSSGSAQGVGGMVTKIKAAATLSKSGVTTIIGNGYDHSLLEVISNSEYGTLFLPTKKKMSSHKRWIHFTGKVSGKITADSGAGKAILENGKSLLPVGIIAIDGSFKEGATIDIVDTNSVAFARGIINFDSEELANIKGLKTAEIKKVLGDNSYKIAIHRNNMVLLDRE